jgi:tRNA (adenine57-N1/adenine58-N1)-methyltransferase
VVEAGAGSGALTCWLLRAAGERGTVTSFERRPDFAEIARRNVERYFGGPHPAWHLVVGDFGAGDCAGGARAGHAAGDARAGHAAGDEQPAERGSGPGECDRVILDMLAPWECVPAAAASLIPGGVICCYVATTTQLSRTVEALRGHGNFDEPAAWESLVRGWHVDGLAVRPEQRMVGHTGFVVTARRLADDVTAPPRRRRPAKGAHPPAEAGSGAPGEATSGTPGEATSGAPGEATSGTPGEATSGTPGEATSGTPGEATSEYDAG